MLYGSFPSKHDLVAAELRPWFLLAPHRSCTVNLILNLQYQQRTRGGGAYIETTLPTSGKSLPFKTKAIIFLLSSTAINDRIQRLHWRLGLSFNKTEDNRLTNINAYICWQVTVKMQKLCRYWFTLCHLILEVREEEHWRLIFRFFIHPWKPYSNAFLLSLTGLHIHIWKPPLCRSPLQCRFRALFSSSNEEGADAACSLLLPTVSCWLRDHTALLLLYHV